MALRATRDTSGRGGGPLAIYACVVGLAVLSLLTVLQLGRGTELVPQLPTLVTVDDDGASCLGKYVATLQSGVFLELYVPGAAGPEGDGLGERIAQGRVDRKTSRVDASGRCVPGTELAGRLFDASLVLQEDTDESPGRSVAVGPLQVDGRTADLELRRADAADRVAGSKQSAPLSAEDVIARIFLAVAVVCVVALLFGQLFIRLGQPRVLGEIVAGIALGPSLLGGVLPEVTGYLFPGEVVAVLRVLAQFGLILFMFLVGLRLDRSLLRGSGHAAVLISHVSIAVPFAFGVTLALLLYPLLGSGRFVGFALFMGAAMAITAFPVLARILTDTGFDRTYVGVLAITCAAVDDVTAWILLAGVTAVVRSQGFGDVIETVVLSVAFAGLMFLAVRPVLAWVANRYRSHAGQRSVVVGGILASLFLAAWATESLGSHAIFGAFLLGVVMPRSGPLVSDLVEKLEDVTALFLLPIFFAIVGLSTRIGVDVQPAVWWGLGAVVLATAVAGKWGASTLAARAVGFDWREANALGVLMNTRGLTEIVILTIGRSLGVVSSALFTIMVLMALATTLMATPLLRALYPGGPPADDLAGPEDAGQQDDARPGGADRVVVEPGGLLAPFPGSGGPLTTTRGASMPDPDTHTPGTPRGEDQGGESNEEGRKGADRPYGQVEDDPMDPDNA